MKVTLFLVLLPALVLGRPSESELEKFEKEFGETPSDDPAVESAKEEALKESEAEIEKINEEYKNGESAFEEGLNPLSDLSKEQMEEEKMGLETDFPTERYTGFVIPENIVVDERSESIIKELMERGLPPPSYNAKKLGLVSPVKNQKACGSCAAFASAAALETCFKKAGGHFGDVSEQHLLNCGFNGRSMNGCNGGSPDAYIRFIHNDNGGQAVSEESFPYEAKNGECRKDAKLLNDRVKTENVVSSYSCGELKLKQMVAEYGAVVTAIYASDKDFQNYKKGIFNRCTSERPNHAVLVVGYGHEDGLDHWLVKNSWGERWGESGYFKMQRGQKTCSIGGFCAAVQCTKF